RDAGDVAAPAVAAAARRRGIAVGSGHGARGDRRRPPQHRPPVAAHRTRTRAAAMTMPQLVLASTSPYRRELLARLRLPFDVARPLVDETPRPGEAPVALAGRLAAAKAAAVAAGLPGAWVLGSDQVAELAGMALGKPGGREQAIAQLQGMRGR